MAIYSWIKPLNIEIFHGHGNGDQRVEDMFQHIPIVQASFGDPPACYVVCGVYMKLYVHLAVWFIS